MERIKKLFDDSLAIIMRCMVGLVVLSIFNLAFMHIAKIHYYVSEFINLYFFIYIAVFIVAYLMRNKIITNKIPMYIVFGISVLMALYNVYNATYYLENIEDLTFISGISLILTLAFVVIPVFLGLSIFKNTIKEETYKKLYIATLAILIAGMINGIGVNSYYIVDSISKYNVEFKYTFNRIFLYVLPSFITSLSYIAIALYFKQNKR